MLEQIVAQTDGIPLFVEEVTKVVMEAGGLTDTQDHDAGRGLVPAVAIPVTLHEALMARLEGEDVRKLPAARYFSTSASISALPFPNALR